MAFKQQLGGLGDCERLAKPKITLKLSSVSFSLSELPGRAGGSMTKAGNGATPALLEGEPLLPPVHLQLSKITYVLWQGDKAGLHAFSRDNTLFHSTGYLGSKENIIAYQLPCEY